MELLQGSFSRLSFSSFFPIQFGLVTEIEREKNIPIHSNFTTG
jgi:hypothetical protein